MALLDSSKMPVQLVGYRFNADQMIRLAKGIQGVESTDIENAWASVAKHFDNHPDHYFLHPIYAEPVAPHFESVNFIFVIFPSSKTQDMLFRKCRRIPRFKQANGYLKALGISEVDDLKLVRLYTYFE